MTQEEKTQVENQENQQESTQQVSPPDEKTVRNALAGGIEEEEFELPGTEETETVQQEEEKEETSITENEEERSQEEPTEPAEQPKTEQPAQEEPFSNLVTAKMWNKVKTEYESQFGEGSFPMPEDINEENEVDVFLDFYSKIIEPDLGDIPQEAKEIINLHKEGKYNPDDYFKNKSSTSDITKLPDEDFLFQTYKLKNGKSDDNPTGWTDEDIRDFLSKKSKIELHELAENGKRQIEDYRSKEKEKQQQFFQQKREKEFEFIQNQKIETAKKVVNQHKNTRNFFGIIELSPQEKAQYDKDFVEMLKMDKKTGMHKIGELLNDDSVLYEIGAVLWKGRDGLKGYISNLKETIKKETEDKLDPKLEEQRGTTKIARPVNRERLI